MKKSTSIVIALVSLAGVVLLLGGIKGGQIFAMVKSGEGFVPPAESVSATPATVQQWPNSYRAVGTVEADEGIVITAEVPGKVQRIAFKSGQPIKAGAILVEQEASNETAQLAASSARLRLAQANYQRVKTLRKTALVADTDVDTALQQMESAQGDVDNLKATLRKKLIRAPFDGRLGIRQVDLGKDLQVGSTIVSLQATNVVRVNFAVPQEWLLRMRRGMTVNVAVGDDAHTMLSGEVTAIGADINIKTRSAIVQTSLRNANNRLVPGMAVDVDVILTEPEAVLVVPATSIIYASFGDTVFVVDKDATSEAMTARQQFIRLGKARGDFVEVQQGLKAGELVVHAGAFKLFNGQSVVLSASPTPDYKAEPTPADN